MRSTTKLTAITAAALLGSTVLAAAQTQPAPGASSSGNVGPGATTNAPMNNSGTMKRDSMTTGSGSGTMSRDGMRGNGMTKSAPTTGPSGQNNAAPTNGMSR